MNALELKIPPALLLILFSLLMWLVVQFVPVLSFAWIWTKPLSWVFYAAGLIFILSGIISFKQANTTVDPTQPERASAMVTSGIYQYTRNPMYLGFLLCLTAWAVRLSNPACWLFLPLFVLYLNRFQIKPEERMLSKLFKQDYTDYLGRVRRWI